MILRSAFVQLLELLEAEPELAGRLRAVIGAASSTITAPALLDRAELAKKLNISPASLDRLRGELAFPELKIGDSPRFELEAVLRWLRARAAAGDGTGLRVVGGGR